MAFRMTDRARAAKVRREWYCDVCEAKWITVHDAGEDEDYTPECEECASMAEQVRRPVGIKTNASRAVEFAHRMSEERLGVTNMRDHLQQGDISAMPPSPIQTSEADAITREILNAGGVPDSVGDHLKPHVQNFWGANGTAGTAPPGPNPLQLPTTIDAARAMAAPAAAESRAMNADPVGLLHAAGKKGLDPTSRQNLVIHSKGS